MRETIQDKINQWFVEHRNPENGEYPDFPDLDDGGSKVWANAYNMWWGPGVTVGLGQQRGQGYCECGGRVSIHIATRALCIP